MTLCPVCPKTRVLQDRRGTWEIQATQDPPGLQVFRVSLDLMALKETRGNLDFRDHLGDKDPLVLLGRPVMKDLKASVTEENQAHQDSRALLDSEALQETLMWGLQDQLDSLGYLVHRDPKECLALPGIMDCRDPSVCLGDLDPKDKEDRMEPREYLVPKDPLLTTVLKEGLVLQVLWVPQDLWDHLGLSGRKVIQELKAFQGLDLKAL